MDVVTEDVNLVFVRQEDAEDGGEMEEDVLPPSLKGKQKTEKPESFSSPSETTQ